MFTVPVHWALSAVLYFGQFSARVPSAARSSARHASFVRPTVMASAAAALQVGSTFSFGGVSVPRDCGREPKYQGDSGNLVGRG